MMMRAPFFLFAAVLLATMAVPTLTVQVQADPDCEQVGVHDNPSGNAAGNGQQCIGVDEPNEPVRDCDHKNSEKDNNDNGITGCIPRGPVDE